MGILLKCLVSRALRWTVPIPFNIDQVDGLSGTSASCETNDVAATSVDSSARSALNVAFLESQTHDKT